MNLFFPGWLFDQYNLRGVTALTDDWVSEWVSDSTDAVTSWGSEVEMTVPVSQFVPSGAGATPNLFHGSNGQSLAAESLPFALRRGTSDVYVVANSYSEKLNTLVQDSNFPSYNANHRSSELVRIVLAAVQPFYEQSQDNPLIRYCLLLCLTLRYAARSSVFVPSPDQATQVTDLMTDPGKVYTSRLLNHQTKGIFYRLAMTYAQEIFTMLEKLMRSRDRSTWPICFASMLILFVCMERLQMLAVNQTAFVRSENHETIPEDEPQSTCRALEDIPFGQLIQIFHAIYRTQKNEQHSFNPFVRGWISAGIPPFEGAAMTMVSEIKQKVFENAPLLPKHNKPLNVEVTPDVFGQENSGRLVAKFLLSFITWSEKNEIEAGPAIQGKFDNLIRTEGTEMISGGDLRRIGPRD
ncbi:hypothetical protein BDZ45DRAFT_282132 [Acephala macrosclerotiorum]|nr:hypothetical protein BDZ45DRAFT_282132 [Acephala macrosclerotiorum]